MGSEVADSVPDICSGIVIVGLYEINFAVMRLSGFSIRFTATDG